MLFIQWGSITPLYVASREGHDQVVEVLIRAGANVNFVDEQVGYVLILAIVTD